MITSHPSVAKGAETRHARSDPRLCPDRRFVTWVFFSFFTVATLSIAVVLWGVYGPLASIYSTGLSQTQPASNQGVEKVPPYYLVDEPSNNEGQNEQLNQQEIETSLVGCLPGGVIICLDFIKEVSIDKDLDINKPSEKQTRAIDHHPERCRFVSRLFIWLPCHSTKAGNSTRDGSFNPLGFLARSIMAIHHFSNLLRGHTSKHKKRSCGGLDTDTFVGCKDSHGLTWFQSTLITVGVVMTILLSMFGLYYCKTNSRRRHQPMRTMSNSPVIPASWHKIWYTLPEKSGLSPVEEGVELGRVGDVESQRDGPTEFPATLGLDGCSDSWRQWLEYKKNQELRLSKKKSGHQPRKAEPSAAPPPSQLPKATLRP